MNAVSKLYEDCYWSILNAAAKKYGLTGRVKEALRVQQHGENKGGDSLRWKMFANDVSNYSGTAKHKCYQWLESTCRRISDEWVECMAGSSDENEEPDLDSIAMQSIAYLKKLFMVRYCFHKYNTEDKSTAGIVENIVTECLKNFRSAFPLVDWSYLKTVVPSLYKTSDGVRQECANWQITVGSMLHIMQFDLISSQLQFKRARVLGGGTESVGSKKNSEKEKCEMKKDKKKDKKDDKNDDLEKGKDLRNKKKDKKDDSKKGSKNDDSKGKKSDDKEEGWGKKNSNDWSGSGNRSNKGWNDSDWNNNNAWGFKNYSSEINQNEPRRKNWEDDGKKNWEDDDKKNWKYDDNKKWKYDDKKSDKGGWANWNDKSGTDVSEKAAVPTALDEYQISGGSMIDLNAYRIMSGRHSCGARQSYIAYRTFPACDETKNLPVCGEVKENDAVWKIAYKRDVAPCCILSVAQQAHKALGKDSPLSAVSSGCGLGIRHCGGSHPKLSPEILKQIGNSPEFVKAAIQANE